MSKTNWDKRFLLLAEHIATWSKDRSRKVGAVIVDVDNRVISMGYNGFPSGCNDDIEERHERPLKYDWAIHGEENAIVNAARTGSKTKDCSMYINLFPCAGCSGLIINSGIRKIVCTQQPDLTDHKYGEEWSKSIKKFQEAKIEMWIRKENNEIYRFWGMHIE